MQYPSEVTGPVHSGSDRNALTADTAPDSASVASGDDDAFVGAGGSDRRGGTRLRLANTHDDPVLPGADLDTLAIAVE